MPTLSLEQLKSVPNSKLSKVIDEARERLKQDEVVQEMFDKFDVDLDELDYIPICFADLPVSARTEHGIIYLNYKLLEKGDFKDSDHYLVHEMTHYLQQTTGDGPTQGSNVDDYLDNPYEQEGFQNQTKYISETKGDKEAEKYTDKVLDHHDVPDEEREERKDDLLQLASTLSVAKRRRRSEQLPLKFGPTEDKPKKLDTDRTALLADFERAVAEGPQESHARPSVKKLHPAEQTYRMQQLQRLMEVLGPDKKE
jgi:hypothetical protein